MSMHEKNKPSPVREEKKRVPQAAKSSVPRPGPLAGPAAQPKPKPKMNRTAKSTQPEQEMDYFNIGF
jgi:hypothetical protein